jgi:hypothetical protein
VDKNRTLDSSRHPSVSPVTLRPFVRPGLDVLFVALNAPEQSNARGHWFSGQASRMYCLMHQGGLLTGEVSKSCGDQIVFGSNAANYRGAQYGIIDLVDDIVETRSSRVKPNDSHVRRLIARIRENEPRFVCVMHSAVRDALNRHADLKRKLDYGLCGCALPGCSSTFVLNYFPNGNRIPDARKLAVFRDLRDAP